MDWVQILGSLDWVKIIVGILSSLVVAVLGKWFDVKLDEAQRKKLDWAIEKGVAAAAQSLKGAPGEEKQQLAIQTAETLAPKAFGKLTGPQKVIVSDATYAKMKSQLPTPTAFSLRGDELQHATEDIGSRRPPQQGDG